jgi:hypothetical protein
MKIADFALQVIIAGFIKMCVLVPVLTQVQAQVLVPVRMRIQAQVPVPNANTVKAPIYTRVIVAIVI